MSNTPSQQTTLDAHRDAARLLTEVGVNPDLLRDLAPQRMTSAMLVTAEIRLNPALDGEVVARAIRHDLRLVEGVLVSGTFLKGGHLLPSLAKEFPFLDEEDLREKARERMYPAACALLPRTSELPPDSGFMTQMSALLADLKPLRDHFGGRMGLVIFLDAVVCAAEHRKALRAKAVAAGDETPPARAALIDESAIQAALDPHVFARTLDGTLDGEALVSVFKARPEVLRHTSPSILLGEHLQRSIVDAGEPASGEKITAAAAREAMWPAAQYLIDNWDDLRKKLGDSAPAWADALVTARKIRDVDAEIARPRTTDRQGG